MKHILFAQSDKITSMIFALVSLDNGYMLSSLLRVLRFNARRSLTGSQRLKLCDIWKRMPLSLLEKYV